MTPRDGGFFLSPAEIYEKITNGDGEHSLQDEQAQTADEQGWESDRAALVKSLASLIQTGWQGQASAGAYGAAMPLAERMLENSEKLDRSQDLLARQVDSFRTAYNSVLPISDLPKPSLDDTFRLTWIMRSRSRNIRTPRRTTSLRFGLMTAPVITTRRICRRHTTTLSGPVGMSRWIRLTT